MAIISIPPRIRRVGTFSLLLSLENAFQGCKGRIQDALVERDHALWTHEVGGNDGRKASERSFPEEEEAEDEPPTLPRVLPGDLIGVEGNYCAVSFLGEGRSSRVYLAKRRRSGADDQTFPRDITPAARRGDGYAAVKVFRCDASLQDSMHYESEMMQFLDSTSAAPFVSKILEPPFEHVGPVDFLGLPSEEEQFEAALGQHAVVTGRFPCIACEVLGSSVDSLMHAYAYQGVKDLHAVKQILWSACRGLAALRSLNIMHCDIKPENLLFVGLSDDVAELMGLDCTDSHSPALGCAVVGASRFNVKLTDFGLSYVVPREVVERRPRKEEEVVENPPPTRDHAFGMRMECLEELGGYQQGSTVATREYRAPEVIFGDDLDCPIDVWSVGCVAYELLTGKILFDPKVHPLAVDEASMDRVHLALIENICGPPSASFLKECAERHSVYLCNFVDTETSLCNEGISFQQFVQSPHDDSGECTHLTSMEMMVEHCSRALSDSPEESARACHFILSCLKWDPWDRMHPADLQNHPWLHT